ncbi:uncharacterized protein LOC143913157 [Arctopsyche grandis]|uniref:uncharacterized protein LOC143913157 n=1 Tax=Arctopsyche grandis TaxID=121162 RepID=UPI00406D6B25
MILAQVLLYSIRKPLSNFANARMKKSADFLRDVITVFCMVTLSQTVYGQEACTTPSNTPGVCVLANACPSIFKILMSSIRTREETQLLQSSIVSCPQSGDTKACCEKPSKSLPPYLVVCKRNDPQINKCIENSIKEMGVRMAIGDSDNGVKQVEPIFVSRFIDGIYLPMENMVLYMQNVTFTGLSNYRVSNARLIGNEKKIMYDAYYEQLQIKSKIRLERPGMRRMQFAGMMLTGDIVGNYSANAKFTLTYKIIKRGDTEYMEFTTVKINFDIHQSNIKLYVMNSEVSLSENDNYLAALTPEIEKSFANTYLNAANEFISQYTYNQLLPES